jgi:hypothetical protein
MGVLGTLVQLIIVEQVGARCEFGSALILLTFVWIVGMMVNLFWHWLCAFALHLELSQRALVPLQEIPNDYATTTTIGPTLRTQPNRRETQSGME